jgi:hypothetical protein
MKSEVDLSANVIDSRDIIARIEELDGIELEERTDEEREELALLQGIADDGEQNASDWHYGEMLIRDSYFAEYCEEVLKECGTLPNDIPWYVAIDWEATADNMKVDFAEIDVDGTIYYIR